MSRHIAKAEKLTQAVTASHGHERELSRYLNDFKS